MAPPDALSQFQEKQGKEVEFEDRDGRKRFMSEETGSVLDETRDMRQIEIQPAMPGPDRTGYIVCSSGSGFHRIAYVEWGDPRSTRVVICAHGLSRQGRDFDWIAAAMASRRDGAWSARTSSGAVGANGCATKSDYNLPQYARDLTTLIARLDVESSRLDRHVAGRSHRHGDRGAARLADRAAHRQRHRAVSCRGRPCTGSRRRCARHRAPMPTSPAPRAIIGRPWRSSASSN